jgi:hypothetical protein
VKEVIESAVIIDPTFRTQVALVLVEKPRVFIMLLKFHQREMISLHNCAKLYVIMLAGRTRYSLAIVKLACDRHAEQQRLGVDPC